MCHDLSDPLLSIREICAHFDRGRGGRRRRPAVNRVSFDIAAGRTLGLVGESGCGKTTLARTILLLHKPTSGDILFRGRSIIGLPEAQLRHLRREVQIIFQDPYSSLNPRMTVGAIVEEPLVVHRLGSRAQRRERVRHMFERVGLDGTALSRYPHEFSGGQRQRIGMARALITDPSLVICDEPTSALDATIQAHILGLLKALQREMQLSYLFISHNLAVVQSICDEVAVMNQGRVVEHGTVRQIFHKPSQPYTRSLLNAIPTTDPRRGMRRRLDARSAARG